MARIDYERAGPHYEDARGMPLEALDDWRRAVERWLPQPAGGALRIVDVGSGTGIFAEAFARWFGADVIGMEPSAAMRREALRSHAHPAVAYVAGDAQSLPLREATCDAAWLSTVIHHIADLDACARECRRVLRPGGVVLIRSIFPDSVDNVAILRFFPAAADVARTFPSVDATAAAFARAGFALAYRESVPQVSARSLAALLDRARTRADTTLTLIDDAAYARGLRRLEEAAADEREPKAVVDRLDLLVFTSS